MDVAIIGASGDCGHQITTSLVAERVLAPNQRLQLVGREDGGSARMLPGLCADLTDAYAEVAPEMDVALRPEDVVADIIVFAAGMTVPQLIPDEGEVTLASLPPRDTLALTNKPVFQAYAEAIARHGHGREVVLVITNPVELGVQIFSQALGRHRVIGIGGYSDSLRFRREIAADLGVRRQRVHGFVIGEHGDGMVPVWSSVGVYGFDDEETARVMRRVRGDWPISEFPQRLAESKKKVLGLLEQRRITDAFALVDGLTPDLRVPIKPYVSHLAGAKTAHVTAAVTSEMVRTLLEGRTMLVAGQVLLDGEFNDLHGPLGVPVVITADGWDRVMPLQLWEDEAALLAGGSIAVNEKIARWLSDE